MPAGKDSGRGKGADEGRRTVPKNPCREKGVTAPLPAGLGKDKAGDVAASPAWSGGTGELGRGGWPPGGGGLGGARGGLLLHRVLEAAAGVQGVTHPAA